MKTLKYLIAVVIGCGYLFAAAYLWCEILPDGWLNDWYSLPTQISLIAIGTFLLIVLMCWIWPEGDQNENIT